MDWRYKTDKLNFQLIDPPGKLVVHSKQYIVRFNSQDKSQFKFVRQKSKTCNLQVEWMDFLQQENSGHQQFSSAP